MRVLGRVFGAYGFGVLGGESEAPFDLSDVFFDFVDAVDFVYQAFDEEPVSAHGEEDEGTDEEFSYF